MDPIVVGAQIVMAMQTLVSREVDPTVPAVVTLATFNAGRVSNVIPDRAVIKGTIRAFDDVLFKHLEQRVREPVPARTSSPASPGSRRRRTGLPRGRSGGSPLQIVERNPRQG